MAKLNEVNEKNKKVIHLMITGMCLRNCKDCCNKQYDINNIPIISKIELDSAETVCFTGGEPCIFGDWQYLAKTYRENLPNLKNIYMYVNADELYKTYQKLNSYNSTDSIKLLDGLSISIKTKADVAAFETILKVWPEIKKLKSNSIISISDLSIFDNICNQ